jgi:hypothetical protein
MTLLIFFYSPIRLFSSPSFACFEIKKNDKNQHKKTVIRLGL